MKNKITTVAAILAAMFLVTEMVAAQVPPANISGMKFYDLNRNGTKGTGEAGLVNWTITLLAEGDEFPTTTLTDNDGNYTFTGLAPGNYTVGEILQAGWEQTAPAGGTYNIALNGIDVADKDFGNFNASQPIIVGEPVTPVILNIDLRTMPVGQPWKEGEPLIEAEGQREPVIIGAPAQIGTTGTVEQSRTGSNRDNAVQQQISKAASAQVSDPLSAPIRNFDGIPNPGKIPPDTNGDVGPNHYIQAVNARFAIFDKAGNWLVGSPGGVDINQLWIAAGQGNDACGINNNGDPIVQYDHLADRWIISQFVAFTNFCIAVSQTPDPVAGGWFLYDFPADVVNDYPKFGVWPDAYYVGTNRGYPLGDAWAFDRTNILIGGIASPPIRFYAGLPNISGGATTFMLPSDLDGPAPPAGAPNVFVRFVEGAEFGGVDRLELRAFHVDFANPAASTFTAIPNLPTVAFDSNLCGFGFRIACIPQPGTAQLLDVLRGEPMYRLQYRNFGNHETLVFNHDVDVNGNDLAGNRWYELRKSGGSWSIFQQGTNSPDATNRWMGSVAMDKDQNMALAYSVSSTTVFPGIRYTGRQASDPLGTMSQGELTLITGGGSQLPTQCTNGPCGNRWGDYSAMTVDPVDECTFWFTSEYYQTNSSGGWRTRIGSFSFSSCAAASISGMKFNDVNGNGIKDTGEPGLAGWTITLLLPNGTIISKITDSSGNYSFEGLEAGNYTVGEVLQPGWIQTAPAGGNYTVTLSGANVTGRDFGNFKGIFGTKFNDLNGNGIRDPGEPGLANWTIKLAGYDNITRSVVTRTAVTDANGKYAFTNVTPGRYTVFEYNKPKWNPTTPWSVGIILGANESIVVDFGNKQVLP